MSSIFKRYGRNFCAHMYSWSHTRSYKWIRSHSRKSSSQHDNGSITAVLSAQWLLQYWTLPFSPLKHKFPITDSVPTSQPVTKVNRLIWFREISVVTVRITQNAYVNCVGKTQSMLIGIASGTHSYHMPKWCDFR